MEIIASISALREHLESKDSVALVPTMGNLHEGHIALMKLAREHAGTVVASIFVNRLQFGGGEDFDRYPRTLTEDCAKLAGAGIDIVFTPDENELYPAPQQVFVEPPPIATDLCGAFRPGHFRGVATVVTKLFNIVQPRFAVFGKKDYQQLHVIRALTTQLNLPIKILAAETLRADDGLALSSRNRYLQPTDRAEAARLFRVLQGIKSAVAGGASSISKLENIAKIDLDTHGWRVDYVALRERDSLRRAEVKDMRLVALAAAWIGNTRLIDNVEIDRDRIG
ncbi:MAG: pantoate--beta-alanine ligase [Pseudomonadota bacterium]|nr:pantoate--beta-alanine ligase [Burkholderiales bacterium]MDQ3196883.1 pantoate--beta-alanine ligase [Pseudomonadota bacterium]